MLDNDDRLFFINPLVIAKRIETGLLLLDSASGRCFELNQVGAAIWAQIEKGITLESIENAVATEYGVPREQVALDTRRLFGELLAQGIIRSDLR